jgi:hypothetical protein
LLSVAIICTTLTAYMSIAHAVYMRVKVMCLSDESIRSLIVVHACEPSKKYAINGLCFPVDVVSQAESLLVSV